MMSYTERNARRGAITQDAFLKRMRELGFQSAQQRLGFLWEFTHPDTPGQLYSMSMRETFSAALKRFEVALPLARAWPNGWPHPDEFWP